MPCTVYSIVHRATGREYVGMTARAVSKRWREHTHGRGQTHIGRAFRKYGADAFTLKVIAELPSRPEALIAERIAIAVRRPELNLTAGGEGVPQFKRVHSPETRAKIAATLTGRKLSAEHRSKLGRPSPYKGVPMSAEVKAKVSASRKLTPKPSQDTVERRARGFRAFMQTDEGRAHQSRAALARWAAWRAARCL